MNMADINCIGLACPAPVLKTKEYIERENPAALEIKVDNIAAVENVSRFLGYKGYTVETERTKECFLLRARKSAPSEDVSLAGDTIREPEQGKEMKKILVLAATDRFGTGDDALGEALMFNFISTLKEIGNELWRLVFVNNGVKLTIEGSETVEVIQELEREGVHVMVCGTCLNHFGLLEKKKVGETTNMLDIVTSMQLADKVINIS